MAPKYIEAFPITDDGWTIRQIIDAETWQQVASIAHKPVDPEIQAQMPKTKERKRGLLTSMLALMFQGQG